MILLRLWHYAMLDALPKNQLISQWRECVCIAKSIYEGKTPNHILVNRIMDYNIEEFCRYCNLVMRAMKIRGYNTTLSSIEKLNQYIGFLPTYKFTSTTTSELDDTPPRFTNWHDKTYLDVCYYNLFEKYHYAKGNSKIGAVEWHILLQKYYLITGKAFEA